MIASKSVSISERYPRPRTALHRLPLFILPGALLLYFLRFGYGFGDSDQDEVIPYLLHRLSPELFVQDWFVQRQVEAFNVRTPFVRMLEAPSYVLPVEWVVLFAYVVCWLLLAGAVLALAHRLTDSRLAAALAVVVALGLTPQWTLGGNDLVHAMLVPSMAGWALGLWGLAAFVDKRWIVAGVLVGAAAWMQALVALQLALLLGLLLLWDVARHRDVLAWRRLTAFSIAFSLIAFPALAPLILQQVSTDAPPAGTPSIYYIMAAFRAPHHYLFYAFPTRSLVRFGLLMVLGVPALAWLARRGLLLHARLVGRLLLFIVLICLVGFVFSEAVPVLAVIKLQLFKTTVLAKLLLVIGLCGAIVSLLPHRLEFGLETLLDQRKLGYGLVLGAWLVLIVGLLSGVDALRERARPLVREATSVGQVERWAREETDQDALFAVPPSWSGFRSHARRAIVIDFKAFPFQDAQIPIWFERLTDVAPIDLPERSTPAIQDHLDEAFLQLDPAALFDLSRSYDTTHVVRRAGSPLSGSMFRPVFETSEWVVYELRPSTREAP